MTGYDPGAECALCKGKCCREKGCSLSPEDMLQSMGKRDGKADRQEILELLKKENGQYAVDFFTDQEGPCFYLRMKHKCYTFVGVDAIGICIALEEKGAFSRRNKDPRGDVFWKAVQADSVSSIIPNSRCGKTGDHTRKAFLQFIGNMKSSSGRMEPLTGVMRHTLLI